MVINKPKKATTTALFANQYSLKQSKYSKTSLLKFANSLSRRLLFEYREIFEKYYITTIQQL